MDRRTELIEALLSLGKQCDKVAKLLTEDIVGDIRDDTLLTPFPHTDLCLDLATYETWPTAATCTKAIDRYYQDSHGLVLDDLRILEYSIGPSWPVSVHHRHARIDLITDDFKFNTSQPENVRIIHQQDLGQYDIGIFWETLEFCVNPLLLLTQLKKHCKKLIIRFRPWTSRDGGFQSAHYNRAYAHLVSDIDTEVKFKVVRPLQTYEALLAKAGVATQERQINGKTPEDFFTNDNFLSIVIARTWGTLRKEEALRIMTTQTVDYTVLP
jgi:hypothetical protein